MRIRPDRARAPVRESLRPADHAGASGAGRRTVQARDVQRSRYYRRNCCFRTSHALSLQMMRHPPIRSLCVADHSIVREGIALLIARQPDIQVVGSVASGEEAVAVFTRSQPDVTLMDLQLRGMSGLEAIREIRRRHHDARIVVLTMYQGDED